MLATSSTSTQWETPGRTRLTTAGIVDAASLIDVISQFRWANNFKVAPYIAFMRKAIAENTLKDWAVIVPEIASLPTRTVEAAC